jgi:hypothetical protein
MSSQLATDEENPHKKLATPVFATFSGLSQIPSLILFVTEFYPFCDGIVPSLKLNFLVVYIDKHNGPNICANDLYEHPLIIFIT